MGMEHLERKQLLLWVHKRIWKNIDKGTCKREIKKNSFPQRNINASDRLDMEVVQAKIISEFKVKLDKIRYGDEAEQAYLLPHMPQLGKYKSVVILSVYTKSFESKTITVILTIYICVGAKKCNWF